MSETADLIRKVDRLTAEPDALPAEVSRLREALGHIGKIAVCCDCHLHEWQADCEPDCKPGCAFLSIRAIVDQALGPEG